MTTKNTPGDPGIGQPGAENAGLDISGSDPADAAGDLELAGLLASLDRLASESRDELSDAQISAMARATQSRTSAKPWRLVGFGAMAAALVGALTLGVFLDPSGSVESQTAGGAESGTLAFGPTAIESDLADLSEFASDPMNPNTEPEVITVAFGGDFADEMAEIDASLGEFELFGLPGDDMLLEGSL